MPVDVRSHCGEPSSVLESCNLCERPRENQKGCRRISEQRAIPLPVPSQAVITDNTFHISQREVIYPSQVEPVAAVMLCGCSGYAMMSFQRKIGFNLGGGLAVLVFFKLCLFFFFFNAFRIHAGTFPNQILCPLSLEPSLPSACPRSLFPRCPALAPSAGSLLGNEQVTRFTVSHRDLFGHCVIHSGESLIFCTTS